MPKKFIIFILSAAGFLPILLFPQPQERYFDQAPDVCNQLRLTILYPSVGSIRSLAELRTQGLIPQKNLLVIGVYHQKEMTPYDESKQLVNKKNLDWIKFHRLSEELEKEKIFQENSLTSEFKKIFQKSDGIIFFGGADIPPSLYHQNTNLLTRIRTPYRHYLELSFLYHLLGGFQDEDFNAFLQSQPQFPLLGICLGCQSLNVAAGGTLVQDIPSQKYGKNYMEEVIALGRENWHTNPFVFLFPEKIFSQSLSPYQLHPIKLLDSTKFTEEMGFMTEENPWVLSSHHQMVDKPGKGFKVAATSMDGEVVEAIQHQEYPCVLGVQFHPEFSGLWDQTRKFKMAPEDTKEKSLLSLLEKNPPSIAFHKELWSWFVEKLKAYHQK